ncbi:cytochrome oxidase assembly protein ShyY1 [Myceligenerans xiligouense]|uniref:SURF1-like protein n=2 Tax=Myceligenerans xiligouense TaxID=253184 RepID=A0A3N4YVX8_9MICO|nr:cytochrome oxidase assembly protein ShyY1 [Myceligenerans xiligouense]
MIVLLLVFLLAAGGCGWLGKWQLDRAFERAELAAAQEAREQAAAGPAGLGEVLEPQASFPGELVGRQVEVTGEFEAHRQVLVAGRAGPSGEVGYLVLTPLRVSDDGTGGESWAELSGAPVLAVVRGWVDEPGAADDPPSGEVTVTGWLQAGEAASEAAAIEAEPAAAGSDAWPVVHGIALGALVQEWGGPIYSAYVVDSETEGALGQLPRPMIDGGTGVNLQNAFYALQWWVFGGFAVALWVRLVRDEMAGGRRGGGPTDPDTGIAGLPAT